MAEFEHFEELAVGLYDRSAGTSEPSHKIFDIGTSKILKSRIWSPYLVNVRPALSLDHRNAMTLGKQQRIRSLMLDSMCEQLDAAASVRPFDHIYGEPEAGTPFTSAIGAYGGYSVLWKRVTAKPGYGTHMLLEGVYHDDEVVAQVDDVITLAETKREADEFLRECGLKTSDVAVLGDREQGGRANLEAMGLHLHAALGMLSVFSALAANKRINQTEHDFLHEYTTGPLMYEEPANHPWKNAA